MCRIQHDPDVNEGYLQTGAYSEVSEEYSAANLQVALGDLEFFNFEKRTWEKYSGPLVLLEEQPYGRV